MKIEDELVVLAHTQFVARHFLVYRGTLEKLVELIKWNIGAAAPDSDQISLFLRKESTQRILEAEHETAIWRSSDARQSWRLVCLAVKPDADSAKRRLARRPPSSDCCSYCWMDEKGFTDQLKPELDFGNPVAGVYLHRACARPWRYLRDLVMRAPK